MRSACWLHHCGARVAISVAGLWVSGLALAGVGVWTTNGPPNGGGWVVADTRNPNVLYAAAEAPTDISRVPLNKSTDNGTTWSAIGDRSCQAQFVSPLATVPPSMVYIGIGGSGPGLFSSSVVASTDGGASCTGTLFGPVINGGIHLALDAVNPKVMYIGTTGAAPLTVGRSLDGGTTWTRIESGLPLGTSYIEGLVADPKTSGTIYLAMTQALFKSVDAGTTWVSVVSTGGQIRVVAVDPSNPSVMYMGGTPGLLQSGSGSVVKSIDGGSTFTQASAGLPNAAVSAFSTNPRNSANLFAATDQGVFESLDGGTSWLATNSGLEGLRVSTFAVDPTGRYVHAATVRGVFDYQLTEPTCSIDARTLCLNNGRFSVTASFQTTSEGPTTPATAAPLTTDTGYFWFFDPANIELVVKVLTGCSVNGRYWVFAGGLTDVGVELRVTDSLTNAVKSYSNGVGTPFQPIQDSSAFPCP